MNNQGIILKICPVVSISDETDRDRIKVRMFPEDNVYSDDDLPYAFPLLPKMIHIKPKVGEAVLILLMQADNGHGNRFYIGPIISQPQYMGGDDYGLNSMAGFPGAHKEPDVAPSTYAETDGAYADDDDIAIYGRKKSDIILKEDDIRIRCGARVKDSSSQADIVFNRRNQAFMQLKHRDSSSQDLLDGVDYQSTATIVADKINLLGNNSKTPFNTYDKKELITDEEMQKIINKAHELPYGDILVEFLNLFRKAFVTHYHPYPGIMPCKSPEVINLESYDTDKILSDSVRIN